MMYNRGTVKKQMCEGCDRQVWTGFQWMCDTWWSPALWLRRGFCFFSLTMNGREDFVKGKVRVGQQKQGR